MGLNSKAAKISKWLDYGGAKSYGSLHLAGNTVYTYNVQLASVNREDKTARVNVADYTVTSSGHRNRVLEALESCSFTVTRVDSPEEL